MADEQPITETILEPQAAAIQHGVPEHYPWLFTFTGEDVLELTSWNVAPGVRVRMQGRVHAAPGQIIPFSDGHTASTDRMPTTTVHSVPEGELLNVVVFCDAGNPLQGQTFVSVAVRRGAGSAFTKLGVLLQGGITEYVARAWPGSPIQSTLESEPYIRTINGTTPQTGLTISEVVPNGARWEVLTVTTFGSFDASPGTRDVYCAFQDGATGRYLHVGLNGKTGAPSTINTLYSWGQGVPPSATTGLQPIGQGTLPDNNRLIAGQRVMIVFNNGSTGDQFGSPTIQVREWLEMTG